MAEYLFNQEVAKKNLHNFFKNEKAKLNSFGNAVNQTFEAFVFAKVIEHYKTEGYNVKIINPKVDGKLVFKLKFSTRGAPNKYSYAILETAGQKLQLRHQLRISTVAHKRRQVYNANICCDIAIIEDNDLSMFGTDEAVPNEWLVSFGEVKHMSAFAELIANFIGLVHELQPKKLRKLRSRKFKSQHLPPFLYVSGYLNPTAKGIYHSIQRRKYDIDIYSYDNPLK